MQPGTFRRHIHDTVPHVHAVLDKLVRAVRCLLYTSHSFGKKAIGRYLRSGKERRYREDRWLKSFGLSRQDLVRAVEDRRRHPFGRFIYPEYEETTKRQLLST